MTESKASPTEFSLNVRLITSLLCFLKRICYVPFKEVMTEDTDKSTGLQSA